MLEAMEILGMDNSLVQINLSLWFFYSAFNFCIFKSTISFCFIICVLF